MGNLHDGLGIRQPAGPKAFFTRWLVEASVFPWSMAAHRRAGRGNLGWGTRVPGPTIGGLGDGRRWRWTDRPEALNRERLASLLGRSAEIDRLADPGSRHLGCRTRVAYPVHRRLARWAGNSTSWEGKSIGNALGRRPTRFSSVFGRPSATRPWKLGAGDPGPGSLHRRPWRWSPMAIDRPSRGAKGKAPSVSVRSVGRDRPSGRSGDAKCQVANPGSPPSPSSAMGGGIGKSAWPKPLRTRGGVAPRVLLGSRDEHRAPRRPPRSKRG